MTGRLHYSEWEADDGSKRSKHEVTAQHVQFLAPKRDGEPAAEASAVGDDPGA